MAFLVGIIIVVASVVVGYMMHSGDLSLLWQANEMLIIVGSAIGSMLIANPWSVVVKSFKACKCLFKGVIPYSKQDHLELLSFLFNVFKLIKAKGMLEIESHIENYKQSDLFAKIPTSTDEYVMNFIRDNLRMLTMGVEDSYQFEDLVDKEIDVYRTDSMAVSKLWLNIADTLPALGIVAAVLGVIVTMRSIAEPPEVLGALIAAALVGTFTGVLLSYGFVGPIANILAKNAEYKISYLDCIKVGFVAYLNGIPPIVVVEHMRKCIPELLRPSFDELDDFISGESAKI